MPFDTTNFDFTKVTPVYDKDNPPKRMSEAIRMAVADAEKIMLRDEYVFELESYHHPVAGKCEVCLAGAVMVDKFDLDRKLSIAPADFWADGEETWAQIFLALDQIRLGCLISAYHKWKDGFSAPPHNRYAHTTWTGDATENFSTFKADMLRIADALQAEGS